MYAGTIRIEDTVLLDDPSAGHGGQILIQFNQQGTPVESSFIGSPFPPCMASYIDVTKAGERNPDLDEGTVTVGMITAKVPVCTFVADRYRCARDPPLQTAGGTIVTAVNNPTEVYTFTDKLGASYGNDVVGSYLIVTAPPGAGLGFPIVGASNGALALQRVGQPAAPPELGTSLIAAGSGP